MLFESSPLPSFVFDAQTLQFLAVNDAAIRQYGYSRQEFSTMTIRDIRPTEEVPALLVHLANLPDQTGPQTWKHRRKDGSLIAVEVSAHSFALDGRAARLVVAHDVTKRKQLEELLSQAHKMQAIGCAVAGVAHEINNPLAYAASGVEYVDEQLAGLSDATLDPTIRLDLRSALREARDGLERVNQIVRDLKGVSRVDDKGSRVDLRKVIESTARIAMPMVKPRAQLVLQLTALPQVTGNAGKLGQVVLNLLVNSAQAIAEGDSVNNRVTLRASTQDEKAIIVVEDTGSGMTPEVMSRLFEPFFTTKPVGIGTGLGLSICRNIIESHGGQMTVKSQVGKGSAFRVELPAAVSS